MESKSTEEELTDTANTIKGENVQVVNINNGERPETSVIKGGQGCGTVCLNGVAARKAEAGDGVTILSGASIKMEKAKKFRPDVICATTENKLPQ